MQLGAWDAFWGWGLGTPFDLLAPKEACMHDSHTVQTYKVMWTKPSHSQNVMVCMLTSLSLVTVLYDLTALFLSR